MRKATASSRGGVGRNPGVLQAKRPVELRPEFGSLCPMIDLGTAGYGAVRPGGVRAGGGWASSGYSMLGLIE